MSVDIRLVSWLFYHVNSILLDDNLRAVWQNEKRVKVVLPVTKCFEILSNSRTEWSSTHSCKCRKSKKEWCWWWWELGLWDRGKVRVVCSLFEKLGMRLKHQLSLKAAFQVHNTKSEQKTWPTIEKCCPFDRCKHTWMLQIHLNCLLIGAPLVNFYLMKSG